MTRRQHRAALFLASAGFPALAPAEPIHSITLRPCGFAGADSDDAGQVQATACFGASSGCRSVLPGLVRFSPGPASVARRRRR